MNEFYSNVDNNLTHCMICLEVLSREQVGSTAGSVVLHRHCTSASRCFYLTIRDEFEKSYLRVGDIDFAKKECLIIKVILNTSQSKKGISLAQSIKEKIERFKLL